jgi:hypothetical protein
LRPENEEWAKMPKKRIDSGVKLLGMVQKTSCVE